MDKENILMRIQDCGIVAVVRAENADKAERIVDACMILNYLRSEEIARENFENVRAVLHCRYRLTNGHNAGHHRHSVAVAHLKRFKVKIRADDILCAAEHCDSRSRRVHNGSCTQYYVLWIIFI